MHRRLFALVLVVALATGLPAVADPAQLVTIYDDAYGVPHVVGATREAMSYGAGYVVARDRLFETDVIRRLGQGRLSEILGAGGNDAQLEADRVMRREFYDRADLDRQVAELPAHIRRELQAFADGFNAALAVQTANPTEMSALFPALGYLPEPWQPRDSATVLMLFTAVTFAGEGAGGELENARLLKALVDERGGDVAAGLAVWQDLLLRNDPAAPPVVPIGEEPAPAPFVSAAEPSAEQLALAMRPGIGAAAAAEREMLDVVRSVVDRLPMPRIGSYALAATGARTRSGKGLLLGAPQAGFLAPSVFYELGLHAPGTDCTGFTVPGLGPYIGIGWCNGHAWSLVAGNAGDQVDMIVETLCGDGYAVVYDGACRPLIKRTESYLVKSTVSQELRTVQDDVYSTIHGPVFHFDRANEQAFVFRRAQAGRFAQTFAGTYALNTARSFDEFDEQARAITATYNLVYADADGTIAYRFTGFQPVRAPTIDHRLPVPGDDPRFEWQSHTLPYERMPHVVNPSDGILHVNQGVDSKPISWWPRASSVAIARYGHTKADQEWFDGKADLTIEALEVENRLIISDVDVMTGQVAWLIDGALAGVDPAGEMGEAYARFDAWRDAGFPRVDADDDGRLDDPAITIFSPDGLNFRRSDLWDRFMTKVWSAAGRQPRAGYIGRMGLTIAAIESPELFSQDYGAGWEAKLRDALSETLAGLRERFAGASMDEWLNDAPTTSFGAVGLLAPPPMEVVDHGTYSQIVDLGEARGVNILPPGNGRADRAADIALHEATGAFPPHFVDQIELYERFAFKPMKMTAETYTASPESVTTLVYVARP